MTTKRESLHLLESVVFDLGDFYQHLIEDAKERMDEGDRDQYEIDSQRAEEVRDRANQLKKVAREWARESDRRQR